MAWWIEKNYCVTNWYCHITTCCDHFSTCTAIICFVFVYSVILLAYLLPCMVMYNCIQLPSYHGWRLSTSNLRWRPGLGIYPTQGVYLPMAVVLVRVDIPLIPQFFNLVWNQFAMDFIYLFCMYAKVVLERVDHVSGFSHWLSHSFSWGYHQFSSGPVDATRRASRRGESLVKAEEAKEHDPWKAPGATHDRFWPKWW